MSFLFFWLLRAIVSLRYRIVVKGVDEVMKTLPKGKGVLILPTHIAEIDPVIVMLVLWTKFHPRPVVLEDFFYLRPIQFLMKLVEALPCPNMEYTVNRWKIRQLRKLQEKIIRELGAGERFLIYPSGRLKTTPQEVLGGASFVPAILAEVSDVSVIMVRITGLWGSSFSRALDGKVPNFGQTLLRGAKIVLKNFLFFTPRREVVVECALAPKDFYGLKDRQEINRTLEAWYNQPNQGKGDRLVLRPYYFWSHKLPRLLSPKKEGTSTIDVALIPETKKREILSRLGEMAGVLPDSIKLHQELYRDLGLDSLDIALLMAFLEERFHVQVLSPADLQNVSDLFAAVLNSPSEVNIKEEVRSSPRLKKEKNRPSPLPPQGATIQEAFLRSCDRMGNAVACVDAMTGPLTYKRLKLTVLILAEEISKLSGQNLGILLPASVGAYISILAVLFAKKTPVMLNWTAGVRALDFSVESTKVDVVLSSLKFLTKLNDLELGLVEDKVVLLEDLRLNVDFKTKLRGFRRSLQSTKKLMHGLGFNDLKPSDLAAILFTSGTETLPKGVPLSHENLLSNQRAALSSVKFEQNDLMYGVLPPFHSFGFSVTGLLPLLAGLKVAYAPDPTQGHSMARDIAAYQVTTFCCAPSFIRFLFQVADPSQLKSLRLIVSGAEKASEQLFTYVAQLGTNAQLLEGYGITECGPIVTLCLPNEARIGVGRPLKGVELCIIDPETNFPIPQGQSGEVCIHGPGVFNGYLGYPRNPFIEIEGKRWYRSGDLGVIAPDGALILSGRLKRFTKIGGEMVSLGGLEEEILGIIKEKGWDHASSAPPVGEEMKGPPIALCAVEKTGEKTYLVLFSIYDVRQEQINLALKYRGYSNLLRVSEVRPVREIPLTGSGKTHYRSLEQTLSTL